MIIWFGVYSKHKTEVQNMFTLDDYALLGESSFDHYVNDIIDEMKAGAYKEYKDKLKQKKREQAEHYLIPTINNNIMNKELFCFCFSINIVDGTLKEIAFGLIQKGLVTIDKVSTFLDISVEDIEEEIKLLENSN